MKATTKANPSHQNNKLCHPGNNYAARKATSVLKNVELISTMELSELTGSFEENIEHVIKKIEMPPGSEAMYKKVCLDLEQTFREELPGVRARLFGSTITGLGFKGSDLDIFMECPNGQPPYAFVKEKAYIMNENKHLYSNLVIVPHARAPIYKFMHVKTNLLCDVAFNDRIGLYHCDLVRFLLMLDPRIRPLFMVVKYWGVCHDITTSGHLSTFALVMMLIFYLQQLKDRLLPPIKVLQDLCDNNKAVINGWDCSFCKDVKKIPKNQNKLNLQSLLYGFFDYYSVFNYKDHIVCPLLGKLISKHHFIEQDSNASLPDGFEIYEKYCRENPNGVRFLPSSLSLCVQDPFNLSYNITKLTAEKHIVKFFWMCGYTCEFIFKKKSVNILKELYSPPLIDEPKDLVLNEKFMKDLYVDSFPLKMGEKYDSVESFTDKYKIDWFEYMNESILLVFEDVFKCKIDNMCLSDKPKNKENSLYLQFDCKGEVPIHTERTRIRKILRLQENTFENETFISNYISSNFKDVWHNVNIHFNMTFHPTLDPPRVSISIFDINRMKFNSFMAFTKYINTFLEDHISLAFEHIAAEGIRKLTESRYLSQPPSVSTCISKSKRTRNRKKTKNN